MIKFVSNVNNPYAIKSGSIIKDNSKEVFISKSRAQNIQIFRDNTANITGRKVLFKHV